MTIRITGLNSGLDTEAIITELMSAYKTKGNKYVKEQTKLSWKQDAWKSLNTKIFNFYKKTRNMTLSSGYTAKKCTVSDSTKATVTANSDAMNGTQSLRINSIAKSGYLTGKQLRDTDSGSTTLAGLGYTGGKTALTLKCNGKDTKIEVDGTTTIDDFVKKINESGADVKASFDKDNHRLFIASKSTGKAQDFSFDTSDANSQQILSGLGLSSDIKGLSLSRSADTKLSSLISIGSGDSTTLNLTDGSGNQLFGITVDENTTIQSFIDDINNNANNSGEIKADYVGNKIVIERSDGQKIKLEAASGDTLGSDVLQKLGLNGAASEALKGADLSATINDNTKLSDLGINNAMTLKLSGNGTETNISIGKDETLGSFLNKINSAGIGVNAAYDSTTGSISIVGRDGNTDGFTIEGRTTSDTQLLQKLGIYSTGGAIKVDGSDAEITLNGVKYTNATNSFSVNGMNIQAQAVTDGEITITTETDVQGIYDKIKDYLTEYNDLIKEMTGLYNAESAKGYEPLTSEEKDAMSDTDIELWEDKVKSALLRRDGTLNGVINAMSGAMLTSYDINGKNYSLSSFGIMTLGYFEVAKDERGMFHIDGDPDDEDVLDKDDKLKKALQEDPDTVIAFFQKLTSQIYSNLDDKMKRTELSSIYTVYNDKEMAISYSDYTDKISAWEKKMSEIEDSYYKKFSQMETALAKLQSQTSSLSSLFG